ncbi:hypothetical protein SAMN05421788_108231 [Filimonas lacunae]|uniref:Uncharacterized protein n=1 Tax=Filimonas lacunae TaxID=477680 RepID=A0A173MDF5_9BACT|nr:hypothetical protein [Filimonas lacunae]BAV05623.1 hypothetical protein FLA_1634 [Filimonas lacunae]SIT29154.1 hypothetical protein SAMN05421788_108231 [Filimonas lacunae]
MAYRNAFEAIEQLCSVYTEEDAIAILESQYAQSLFGREIGGEYDLKPGTSYAFNCHLKEVLRHLYQWNNADQEKIRNGLQSGDGECFEPIID